MSTRPRPSQVVARTSAGTISLRTPYGSITYPAEKLKKSFEAWNNFVVARLILSGNIKAKISYPDNYEYRWIFDPIVERVPSLKSDSPLDYYVFTFLSEELGLPSMPGPASMNTISRIVGYMRRGWENIHSKRGNRTLREMLHELPKSLEERVGLARLLIAYGYYDCRKPSDCAQDYDRTIEKQLEDLVKEFDITTIVFMEELTKAYGDRTIPVLDIVQRTPPSRIFLPVIEETVAEMARGETGKLLEKLVRTEDPHVRLTVRHENNTIRITVSSHCTNYEEAILVYNTRKFLGAMNSIADMVVSGKQSACELLVEKALAIENAIIFGPWNSSLLLLEEDHYAYFPFGVGGSKIDVYTDIRSLAKYLAQTGSYSYEHVIRTLFYGRELLVKYASGLLKSREEQVCPVCDELLLYIPEKDIVVGRFDNKYIMYSRYSVKDVKIGETLSDVLPEDRHAQIRLLEHFSPAKASAYKELVELIEHYTSELSSEIVEKTCILYRRVPVCVILYDNGRRDVLVERARDRVEKEYWRSAFLGALKIALEKHGWTREEDGVYVKDGVRVVLPA